MMPLAKLAHQLGDIPLERIVRKPRPGKATEADHIREKRLCEMINGTLIEKVYGFQKSQIGMRIGCEMLKIIKDQDLGFVTGTGGPYRMKSGNIRMPDAAYVSWKSCDSRKKCFDYPIGLMSPEIVCDVFTEHHTAKEIAAKREDYLETGVKLVWIIDPRKRTVTVHRADGTSEVLDHKAKLTGETVLPGFKLEIGKFL